MTQLKTTISLSQPVSAPSEVAPRGSPPPETVRVVAVQAVYIPGLLAFEPGKTYNLPALLAFELLARGVVQPYVDVLDGDQPTVHVVRVEDSVGVADAVGG
jgi:hypothetical protein